MPKLIYFDLQGRAQAIRYLLAYKGVQFEDVRMSFEEWGAAKAAGTYGEGVQLPLYVDDAGMQFSQSKAILEYLALEHNVTPANNKEAYEVMWAGETRVDHDKPEGMAGLFQENAPAEVIDVCVENMNKLMTKYNTRWADGRAHVAGATLTAADFGLLTAYTSIIANPNLRNPVVSERMKTHYETLEHV